MARAAVTAPAVRLDRPDIQAVVATGFGSLPHATFVVFTFGTGEAARDWVRAVTASVTTAADDRLPRAVNVAFTQSGLRRLGVPEHVLAQYSREFTGGMTTPHRQRLFGDVGESVPENWVWGGPGDEVDGVLLLYADSDTALRSLTSELVEVAGARALARVVTLDTTTLSSRDHFGFNDAVSQPVIEGLRSGLPADTVRMGEFLLGYRNEYGLFTPRPLVPPSDDPRGLLPNDVAGSGSRDLGRNGTYLVFRQLHQDVAAFRDFLHHQANAALGDGRQGGHGAMWLAARLIGRWPNGTPLVKSPDREDPALAGDNDFAYHHVDQDGRKCPIGAHIRRAHPRDSLDPAPGTARSWEVDRRHRLLRRGRQYGPQLPPGAVWDPKARIDQAERGLHFIALNANISRQFEFVSYTWLNSPKFAGLYDDPDPIVGTTSSWSEGLRFTVETSPVRRTMKGIPQFVTVRGGGYFFLPSISMLRWVSRDV